MNKQLRFGIMLFSENLTSSTFYLRAFLYEPDDPKEKSRHSGNRIFLLVSCQRLGPPV